MISFKNHKYAALDKQSKHFESDGTFMNNLKLSKSSSTNKIDSGSCNWMRVIIVIFLIFFVTLAVNMIIFYSSSLSNQFCFLQTCDETSVFIYDGKHQTKSWPKPPPHQEVAKVARYVMHISEYGSLATISTHKNIEGYPFTNIFSVSDGPFNNSTGVPYFYLTPMELSVKDLEVNKKASLTVSLAQSSYCAKERMDPEDPRCAHIILSGDVVALMKDSVEEAFAKKSLFSRHWEMDTWPNGHSWFFAKLDINHIYVLDFFGGATVVDVKDYYSAGFLGQNHTNNVY